MTPDAPLAEFDISSGALRGSRLTLFANRLTHHGGDSMETVPLARLAAVGVAYERDPGKLNWAIVLLVLALGVLAVSGPLQAGIAALVASIKEHTGRESLESALLVTFSVLGRLARMLPLLAAVLAALAVALLVYFWLGLTTLTLSVGAAERSYAVRGRNPLLIQFAELVAAQLATQLAARKD